MIFHQSVTDFCVRYEIRKLLTNIAYCVVALMGYCKLLVFQTLGFYTLTAILLILKNLLKIILYFLYKVMEEACDYIPFILLTVGTWLLKIWRNKQEKRARKHRIMSPYCYELVDDIEDLADDLAPNPEYMREGRKAAQKVFEQLKQNSADYDFKIGKTKIAGSFGKGTGISFEGANGETSNPDLDLIVFVNDEQPPFGEVFDKFEELLEEMYEVSNIRVMTHSIQFNISTPTQGDIEVDLLAATNRLKHTAPFAGQDVGDVEARLALQDLRGKQLKAIRETQNVDLLNNKFFSSAFSMKTVDVIESYVRDPFVLKVVRLSKFWNYSVDIPSRLAPARSCMIELIAIHCQIKRRGRGRHGERCLVSGFRRFLEAISHLRTLDISLSDANNNDSYGEMVVRPKNYTTPMVRDPVNSWNNLAQGLHPDVIDILVIQAKKTLRMLERLKRSDSYERVENPIDEIFCHKE